jgi:excisionase family DNA binding protein
MTIKETADAIGRSRQRVHILIKKGKLEAKKVAPRLWVVDKKSVEEFIESRAE